MNAIDQRAPSLRATPKPSEGAQPLPDAFLQWVLTERRGVFSAFERGEMPASFASHLPVVNTIGTGDFPIHSATKGAGLTARDEEIPALLHAIDDCLAACEGHPWSATMGRRIQVAHELYARPDRIDPRRFGLIEIFRGNTYHNVLRDPRVTLLFTGPWPHYRSYQVNCVAEVVEGDDPRFRAILGMRQLFERDRFHIQQPLYPLGYLLWVHEVIDKSPRFGHAGRRLAGKEEGR